MGNREDARRVWMRVSCMPYTKRLVLCKQTAHLCASIPYRCMNVCAHGRYSWCTQNDWCIGGMRLRRQHKHVRVLPAFVGRTMDENRVVPGQVLQVFGHSFDKMLSHAPWVKRRTCSHERLDSILCVLSHGFNAVVLSLHSVPAAAVPVAHAPEPAARLSSTRPTLALTSTNVNHDCACSPRDCAG